MRVAERVGRTRSGLSDSELLQAMEPQVGAALARVRGEAPRWPADGSAPWGSSREGAAPVRSEVVSLALQAHLVFADDRLARSEVVTLLGDTGPWAEWARWWRAAKVRHSAALHGYLSATSDEAARGADVPCLRRPAAPAPPTAGELLSLLVAMAAAELGTSMSYQAVTGLADDPAAAELLGLLAADDALLSALDSELLAAAMRLAPSRAVRAVATGVMSLRISKPHGPAATPKARMIAEAHIYDLRVHLDHVLLPLLRGWGFFDVEGLDEGAERSREQVLGFLMGLDEVTRAFTERRRGGPVSYDEPVLDVELGMPLPLPRPAAR